jgi:hydrolase, TatD family
MPYKNIFDSHAHYTARQFAGDRKELLDALPDKGVRNVMCVADTLAEAEACAQLAARYDWIYCSAGVHPHNAKDAPKDLEACLQRLLKRPKMMAVGEIGLDYHYDFSPRPLQLDLFERQLILANQLELPVIVHDREAHADTMQLLEKHKPKGVVHCYSGSAEMAKQVIALGMYIGFTGAITFPKARRAIEALSVIPNDRLLIETDAPYMAPVPLRGKRCDSGMIPYTAAVMAQVKGLQVQEILDLTHENACRLYGIVSQH